MKIFSFFKQLISRIFIFSRKTSSESHSSTSDKRPSPPSPSSSLPKLDMESPMPAPSRSSLQENFLPNHSFSKEDQRMYVGGHTKPDEVGSMVDHQRKNGGSVLEASTKWQTDDLSMPDPLLDIEEKVKLEDSRSNQILDAMITEAVEPSLEICQKDQEGFTSAFEINAIEKRQFPNKTPVGMDGDSKAAEAIDSTLETDPHSVPEDRCKKKPTSGSICETIAVKRVHKTFSAELKRSNKEIEDSVERDAAVDDGLEGDHIEPGHDIACMAEEALPCDDQDPPSRLSGSDETDEWIANHKKSDVAVEDVNLESSIQGAFRLCGYAGHSVDSGSYEEQDFVRPVHAHQETVEEDLLSKPFPTFEEQCVESLTDPIPKNVGPPCPFERLVLRPEMLRVEDRDIETFLKNLENNDFEDLLSLKLPELEERFLKSLERFDYIGELPISRQFFERFVDYLKIESEYRGRPDPRYTLPTLFVISMVFFARYSETDTRAFWEPYAQEVWDREELQYFGNICRTLFEYSRYYLQSMVGLSFDIDRRGDVVRPVYQHAIIPSYLQENFAEWLVGNFSSLMHYPADQLQRVLATEKSLNYVYPRLRNFIRGADTQEAAARLIDRMTDAIALFHEEESGGSVEKALNSNLERSIWRILYRKLVEDPESITALRKISPQLTWRWSEGKGLHLYLANVRSPEAFKPRMIIWAHSDDRDIKIRNLDETIYPWRNRTDRIWELEPEVIRVRGPLDGRLILISDKYDDLNKTRKDQEDEIILERSIPSLPEDILFFRLNDHRDAAVLRDTVDTDGTWIIFSKKEIYLEDMSKRALNGTALILPPALLELGFTHATKVRLSLPVILASHNQKYDKSIEKVELNPMLFGNHKLQRMSKDLPPVFSSPNIKLEIACSPDSRPFKRYILRIRQNGRSHRSYYLSDLMKEGLLNNSAQGCLLDLTLFMPEPGHYTVDLRHNLKSMLDEPLQLAWLPDTVRIHEPDVDVCFSSENPLRISIGGVPSDQIQPYDNEEYQKTQIEDLVEVTWPMLKGKRCRFDIYWEDYPIHFGWDVDRVAAWIKGGGDANHVIEGEEGGVYLYVRGKSRERYSIQVEDLGGSREEYLNAKGVFEEPLLETVLRDMLMKSNQVESSVTITMRDYEWRLFDYFKKPDIRITRVSYPDDHLQISLECNRNLKGNYTFQIRNKEYLNSVETIAEVQSLGSSMNLLAPYLAPGLYILEIAVEGTILATSDEFRVLEQVVSRRPREDRIVVEWSTDRNQVLFQTLTSPLPHTITRLDERFGIAPLLEHLEDIHTRENWLNSRSVEERERRLLPAWAVLGHPLRFETKKHRRILHIYPEQTLYGGKIGKGYVDLKILDERIRVAAYWQPSGRNEFVRLWMRIPQNQVTEKLGELDPLDLWPAYQCKGCGELLASREGSYLALPPNVVQAHQHNQDIHIRRQFLDTVYPQHEDPLEATISQYKGMRLLHAYRVEEMITPNFLLALIEGAVQPEEDDMEVSVPVYWQDALDFQVAVSELFGKLDHEEITRLEDYSDAIESIFSYFEEKEDLIPPYAAVLRMLDVLDERAHPYNIPRHILLLAMVLRTKGHKPIRYMKLMRETTLTERDLMTLIDLALTGCPKLFEWSIAWAELLFVHAAS